MSVIVVPYALGDGVFINFKEISEGAFKQLCRDAYAFKIAQRPSPSIGDGLHEARVAANKVRELAKIYAPKYEVAKRKLDEFKQIHKRIFDREERLRDTDSAPKLWWIITGTSQRELLDEHLSRNKIIYDERKRLWQEVIRYEPYIPENLEKTIRQARDDAQHAKESEDRKRYYQWEQENEKIRKEFNMKLRLAHGYHVLIKDLRIETDGAASTISGQQEYISEMDGFVPFKVTLINKTIKLTR
ncbi:hypothetical protein HDR66_01030 [bacterium]|nr:hypothetical protein [bacterium]